MADEQKQKDLEEISAQEYYKKGESDRTPYEDRAKLISKLTVPYLIREESDTGTTQMADSNAQSYGGQLVNTLRAKMGMALLPPSTSSFRLLPDPAELEALTQGSPDNKAKISQQLSGVTTTINAEIEVQQIRNSLFDLISQLIVVGSCIAEKKKDAGVILHTLQSYVVTLDNQGVPTRLCFVEELDELPSGVEPKDEQDTYQLYTMAYKEIGAEKWTVFQEIEGERVGSESTYKTYDDMPFRYLGWIWMSGDSYHRPYAEDYYKDLEQLDKLAQLLTDGALIAAKQLIFVNQRGGRTRKDDVAESANGDVVDGSADDVTSFKNEKNFDFQMPMEREQAIQKRLASAFLMNESVTRDAERVTAEEIQFMAKELETSSLSGIYSKLSLQWSKWLVVQTMKELKIKFDSVEVDIITGLDALGRSQIQQQLDGYVERLRTLEFMSYLKPEELIARYADYAGIDTTGLLKTPSEVQAEQQQAIEAANNQAMIAAGAEATGKAAGEQAVNNMGEQEGQQGQQQ